MSDRDEALEALELLWREINYTDPGRYDVPWESLVSAHKRVLSALERQRVPEWSYPSPLPKVNRFEVIDPSGRAYVEHEVKVSLSFQDDGRTLKAFVDEAPEPD